VGDNYMADIYQLNQEKIKKNEKFSEQEVDLQETPLFFPAGFEEIFLGIYFIFLPYIGGILFQFFYIAKMEIDIFLVLNNSILLTWTIGYEIIAAIVLLYIAKESIVFKKEISEHTLPTFKRPY
jgi:hypothetical protein